MVFRPRLLLGAAVAVLGVAGAGALRLAAGQPAAALVRDTPRGAAVALDLAYGPAPEQQLDVYRPRAAKAAPVIVLVHGGGWVVGDKAAPSVVEAKAAHWLDRGYVVVSVNYRLWPRAGPLEQARDVARALAFVQANAARWGGNGADVTLTGHSAGGHLVALLAADPALAASMGAKPWRATVVLDGAAYDVPWIMGGAHPRLYDRVFGDDPTLWRAVSPADRLTGAPGPMLLVCSTWWTLSCPFADDFAERVRRAGGRAEVLIQDLSHREINTELGLPGPYTAAVDRFIRSARG